MEIFPAEIQIRKALTRSELYKVLSKSFLYPTREVYEYLLSTFYRETILEFSASEDCTVEVKRCIRELADALDSWDESIPREAMEFEYNRLFAHLGSAKAPPYETEYGHENVFQKTEAMADIAGFYRAYELEVADTNTDRVDFISTELEYMSYLALKEAYALEHNEAEHREISIDSQRKFLQDHLGRWVKIFGEILVGSTVSPFYAQVGKLLQVFVESDTRALGVSPKKITAPPNAAPLAREPFSCDGCEPLKAPSEI